MNGLRTNGEPHPPTIAVITAGSRGANQLDCVAGFLIVRHMVDEKVDEPCTRHFLEFDH